MLWLYPGDRRGGWYPQRRSLGSGWNTVDQVSAAGDLDGDGQVDVIARRSDRMWLYAGDGAVVQRPATATSATADARARAFVAGDFSGDGRVDALAVDPVTGGLYRYLGDGNGGLGAGEAINAGWNTLRSVGPAGDFDNDGRSDLIGIGTADNRLYLYRGDGAGGFLDRRDLGGDWAGVDVVLAVGPWDAGGAADLVSRDRSTGQLRLHPGSGASPLLPGYVINAGWSGFDLLMYAGDLDASGWPDLVARVPGASTFLLYPGGPSGQIYPPRQLSIAGVASAAGVSSLG
jgi:hypothetical protein